MHIIEGEALAAEQLEHPETPPTSQQKDSLLEKKVQIITTLLAAYRIPTTASDHTTFYEFFEHDPEMTDTILQFFIGFIEFRRSNPVVLVERYQKYLMDIIYKTNNLLTLGMLNPYYLVEIPQHNAVSLETVTPKKVPQFFDLDAASVQRFDHEQIENGRKKTNDMPQILKSETKSIVTREEVIENKHIGFFLKIVASFNEWIKKNEGLLKANLSAALTGKSSEEVIEIIHKLQIKFVDEEEFYYGLDATNESGQTYSELMFSKLLLVLEGSKRGNTNATEFSNLLRIRDYAENPNLFTLTFLLSMGVSEVVCRKILNVSSESFAKMRDTIAQYMGHFSANKGTSLNTISMALGRECSAFSEWNPFMNQAVAALDYCHFYKLVRCNFFKSIPENAALTEQLLTEAFDHYKKLVQNQQSRAVSPQVWELVQQYHGDQTFVATLEFVKDLYKERASHNGFGTRMLKMRARKAKLSLSGSGKIIADLLGVEQQIIGSGYVFVPEGVVMWLGAALEQAKK